MVWRLPVDAERRLAGCAPDSSGQHGVVKRAHPCMSRYVDEDFPTLQGENCTTAARTADPLCDSPPSEWKILHPDPRVVVHISRRARAGARTTAAIP
jgi:hypothetical protein